MIPEKASVPSLFIIKTPLTPLWELILFSVSSTSLDILRYFLNDFKGSLVQIIERDWKINDSWKQQLSCGRQEAVNSNNWNSIFLRMKWNRQQTAAEKKKKKKRKIKRIRLSVFPSFVCLSYFRGSQQCCPQSLTLTANQRTINKPIQPSIYGKYSAYYDL